MSVYSYCAENTHEEEEEEENVSVESPLLPDNNKISSEEQINIESNLLTSGRRKSSIISCRRRSSISILDNNQHQQQIVTTIQPEIQQNNHQQPQQYQNCNHHNHTSPVHSVESFQIADEKDDLDEESNQNSMDPNKYDAVAIVTGEWGKWQLRTVLLIFLCKIPSSWFMACIIFTAPAPRHGEFYCKPPDTVGNHSSWIKISHPEKEESDDQEFNIDFCNVYADAIAHAHDYFRYESQKDEPKLWEEPTKNGAVIPCNTFQHEADYHSIITQFDLVCSRDILVALTQFFHLFGVLTGGILATILLKHFSPRNVMMFGMLTQIFCGNMTGLVISYELHVFFRCLSAVCCAQMYTAGAMIFSDITGGKYRTTVICLHEQFWSIGVILLPGVASFVRNWTQLYMAISFPTLIIVYLWKWIPDSPRWLLQRGRILEAKEILMQCVEMNGTQHSLPYDIDEKLRIQSINLVHAPPPSGWWSMWSSRKTIRCLICCHLAWSIYIVIYYGMLLNIRAFSREHLEINTAIAGTCEIIGTFIGLFLILNTSKKWLATGLFNIISGCIAYCAWLIPPEIKGNNRVALFMLSAMISKAAISCTLSILTTCTTELVTDDKKKICAFSTIVWARIWLLTAPFVGATIVFGQLIPQTAFASLGIVGGLLTLLIDSPSTIAKKQKSFRKTKPTTNLPPELMPGIWTTKLNDEHFDKI